MRDCGENEMSSFEAVIGRRRSTTAVAVAVAVAVTVATAAAVK